MCQGAGCTFGGLEVWEVLEYKKARLVAPSYFELEMAGGGRGIWGSKYIFKVVNYGLQFI